MATLQSVDIALTLIDGVVLEKVWDNLSGIPNECRSNQNFFLQEWMVHIEKR
jgi:hypothetical protein